MTEKNNKASKTPKSRKKRTKPTVSDDQFKKILKPFVNKNPASIAALLKMPPSLFLHAIKKYNVQPDITTPMTEEQLWSLRYYFRMKMKNLYPEQKGNIEFQQYKTQKAREKSTLGTGKTPFDRAKRFGIFKIIYTGMKG